VASRVRTIDFDHGGAESHPPFARAVDVLGDGSVRLLYTPGHTSGHFSVLVRLAEREVLLVGDAVYTLRNLRDGTLPFRMVAEAAYKRSLGELRAYAQQHPDALIIPTHDAGVWEGLQDIYE